LHVAWAKHGDALYAAVARNDGGGTYRLVVEPFPTSRSWDWTVWRLGQSRHAVRHGIALSVTVAMADAEAAVMVGAA
jgi:hypothetical protein